MPRRGEHPVYTPDTPKDKKTKTQDEKNRAVEEMAGVQEIPAKIDAEWGVVSRELEDKKEREDAKKIKIQEDAEDWTDQMLGVLEEGNMDAFDMNMKAADPQELLVAKTWLKSIVKAQEKQGGGQLEAQMIEKINAVQNKKLAGMDIYPADSIEEVSDFDPLGLGSPEEVSISAPQDKTDQRRTEYARQQNALTVERVKLKKELIRLTTEMKDKFGIKMDKDGIGKGFFGRRKLERMRKYVDKGKGNQEFAQLDNQIHALATEKYLQDHPTADTEIRNVVKESIGGTRERGQRLAKNIRESGKGSF